MTAPIKNLNIITVMSLTSFEVQSAIYPLIKVPKVGPNNNVDVEDDLVPLLSDMANEHAFLCHMHAVCVASKADMDNDATVHKFGDKLVEVRAKIEILYRALKAAEANWSAVSRIITVLNERPHSRLKKAGSI
jgi:hypothetical protein